MLESIQMGRCGLTIRQESLIAENEPDPMDGEQTWPTEEELRNAEGVFLCSNHA